MPKTTTVASPLEPRRKHGAARASPHRTGSPIEQEICMETRVFDVQAKVLSTDGSHSETFNKGERVKNVQRFGRRVMFEPVSTHRIAGTYAMDWSLFEAITTAVHGAKA